MDERHEPSHPNLRALAIGAGIVAGGIALAVAVPWAIIARVPTPANAPNNAEPPRVAAPAQVTAPRLQREAFDRDKGRP